LICVKKFDKKSFTLIQATISGTDWSDRDRDKRTETMDALPDFKFISLNAQGEGNDHSFAIV